MQRLVVLIGFGFVVVGALGCSDRSDPPLAMPDAMVDAVAPVEDAAPGEDAEPGSDATVMPDAMLDGSVEDAMTDASAMDAMPMMEACEGGDTYLYVLNRLDVARVMGGVSRGFNLDGRVSDGADSMSCNKRDFVSPSGVMGVDNQLQALLPTLEALSGVSLTSTITASIAAGELLVLVELSHVDSFASDDCVTMSVLTGRLPAGTAAPTLDASGRLAAGQTFDVSRSSYGPGMEPLINVEGVRIVGGRLEASGFDLSLPIPAGSAGTITLVSRSSQLEFNATTTGLMGGSLGGAVRTSELGPALGALMLSVPVGTILSVVNLQTDLEKSGRTCEALSAALELDGVPAVMGAITAP